MIMMSDESFAQRLFTVHLDHCRRVHEGLHWKTKLWTDIEILSLPKFNHTLYQKIKDVELKQVFLKLFLLSQKGGVVVDNAYVCMDDHSYFNQYAKFFVSQEAPVMEDNYPLMSAKMVGANKKSEILK